MIRNITLFIHLLGVVTLFIAIGLLQRSGARARTAATVEEARLWLSFAGSTGRMFPAAFVMILLTGLYLAQRGFTFSTPWVVVAIVAAVILGIAGGVAVGPGIRERYIAATAAPAGPIGADLAQRIRAPRTWVIAGLLNGMTVGLLWVMVNKPAGWIHPIVAIAGLGVVAAVVVNSVVKSGR